MIEPASPSRLKHPLLLIPGGGNSKPDFEPLLERLTTGTDNRSHLIEHPRELRTLKYTKPDINILVLRFPDRIDTLARNAKIIQQVLRSFADITGSEKYCIGTNCKGALDFRYYLSQLDGDNFFFPKAVYVAPPNRGFVQVGETIRTAGILKFLFRLPIRTLGGYYINRDTAGGLAAIRTDYSILGRPNNRELAKINHPLSLAVEKERTGKSTVIAGAGLPLFSGRTRWPVLRHGMFFLGKNSDSVIPLWSARLPNAYTFVIRCQPGETIVESGKFFSDSHKRLITDETAVGKMAEEFKGDPIPDSLKERIAWEEEPLTNFDDSLISRLRMQAHGAAGIAAGLLIGAAAAGYSVWYVPTKKSSPILLGAIRFGRHQHESSRRYHYGVSEGT